MIDNVKIFGSDKQLKALEQSKNTVFVCVLGNTGVSKIPGISGAGGTPGLLTKTTVELLDLPFIPISAGLEVEPQTSYISLNGQPGGNIKEGKGVPNPEEIFESAKETGQLLSSICD
ncbi:MAG: TIGR00303 family protein, partial [Methanosphaera sp. rholeuAM74]